MTTFFDARFIRPDNHDGISRFAANLFTELSKRRDITAIISDLKQLRHLPEGTKHVLECAPTSPREIGLAIRLNRLGATLVYSPMQTTGSFAKKFKLVLTLHDLIYYRHRKPPSEFSLLVRALWRLYHLTFLPARMMLSVADGLITISETSLRAIKEAELFRGPTEVILNAPETTFASGGGARQRPEGTKKLVYMGSFMDYKNVETLVRATAHLDGYELHLLSRISETRQRELEALAPADKALVFHNGVSDEEYRALLQNAWALVSASRDEGFGIPLVEAQSIGTPVVCSNIEIFREVCKAGALFFDPNDPTDVARQVGALETNWEQMSEASLANSKRFAWSTSAQKLDEFLASFD